MKFEKAPAHSGAGPASCLQTSHDTHFLRIPCALLDCLYYTTRSIKSPGMITTIYNGSSITADPTNNGITGLHLLPASRPSLLPLLAEAGLGAPFTKLSSVFQTSSPADAFYSQCFYWEVYQQYISADRFIRTAWYISLKMMYLYKSPIQDGSLWQRNLTMILQSFLRIFRAKFSIPWISFLVYQQSARYYFLAHFNATAFGPNFPLIFVGFHLT